MPADLYFTETGDLAIASNGDIAVTDTTKTFLKQQCQTRLATQITDFAPYSKYGADMQRLVGLPNTVETARLGKSLIVNALSRDGLIPSGSVKVQATPTYGDTIEFVVDVIWGTNEYLQITLEQLLRV